MSDNLTPTAQAVLDHLHDQTPTTAADLRQATGRSRSAIDKALAELAKAGQVTKTPSGTGDGPTLWTLTDAGPELAQPPGIELDVADDLPDPDDAPSDQDSTGGSYESSPWTDPADDAATPSHAGSDGDGDPSGHPTGQGDNSATDSTAEPVEEVKVCRGCGEQMPKTCPTCRQRTASYCGTCRATQPATRRRAPCDPQILANGLPKLRPGELERLVADVIATQPLPDHLGITGWTSGRVAIFLPGRSTGAIGNALDKLTATGQAQLLADNPKRYQPTPAPAPGSDQPDGGNSGDAGQQ